MKLVLLLTILLSPAAFAQGLPTFIGSVSKIRAVTLVPDGLINGSHIMATVAYHGGCSAPVSFTVTQDSAFTFTVVENRVKPAPGVASCGAVTLMSEQIEVGTIHGPDPEKSEILVNGTSPQ